MKSLKKKKNLRALKQRTVSVADVGIVECGRCVGAKGNRIMKYLCGAVGKAPTQMSLLGFIVHVFSLYNDYNSGWL